MNFQCPNTWLLLGQKAGDNNQLLALAEALGWPYETRSLRYQPWELLSNRLLGATLAGVDRTESSALEAPWPDLVLTAGRRNEPVAKWIRRRSGGKCRLVHLGRPWSTLAAFDLVVTTPQYFLPQRTNVLHNLLPLHGITPQRLVAAGSELQPRLAGLRRPYTTVLIGGNSGAFVFTRQKGRQLGQQVNGLVRHIGGTALVSNSPRTPEDFYAAFLAELQVPKWAWRWKPEVRDNPYLGCLALAHQFVVTGESMSMLAEAGSRGLPMYVFDPGEHDWRWCLRPHNWHHKVLSQRLSTILAPRRMRRDVGRIQRAMVDSGRAAWLGEGWIDPLDQQRPQPSHDLEQATMRVRALFSA